jgi:hypothetical protein
MTVRDTLAEIESKVDGVVRLSETAFKFCCVCHEDSNPSATARISDDGNRILLGCFGCNAKAAELAAAIGIGMSDLFDKPNPPSKSKSSKSPKGFPTAWNAMHCYQRKLGKPAKTWDYHDATGKFVLQVGRFNQANGEKEFRPVSLAEDGLWYCKAPDVRPLYNLPAVLLAETVIVVEGEKAADATNGLGIVATTSMNGAKSPGKTDWSPLIGKNVVIIPDNDDAGRQYAATVAGILHKLGGAA